MVSKELSVAQRVTRYLLGNLAGPSCQAPMCMDDFFFFAWRLGSKTVLVRVFWLGSSSDVFSA